MASGLTTNLIVLNMLKLLKQVNSVKNGLSKFQARFLIASMLIITMTCIVFFIDGSQTNRNRANQLVGIPADKAHENYVVIQDGENYYYSPSGWIDLRSQISKQQFQDFQEVRSQRSATWGYCVAISGAITMALIFVLEWEDAEEENTD